MKYIFLLGIFLSPFIFWPHSNIVYEIPRVVFIHKWIEVLGITAVLLAFFVLKKQKLDNVLISLVAIFTFLAFISSYVGVDFDKSFWGNYYRSDGLVTLVHLTALFFIVALYWDKTWKKSTSVAMATSSLFISLWSVIYAFQLYVLGNPTIPNWDMAIAVSFGNPNFLAGYLLVALPFSLYLLDTSKKKFKKYLGVAIIVQFLAIVLTLSTTGVLGIVLLALLWGMIRARDKKARVGFGFLLIFLVFLILPYITSRVEYSHNPHDYVAESRERIYNKALLSFKEKPLLGWGWANFDYAFESNEWPIKFDLDVYVDKAHSHFVEILVTTGVIGLLVYLTLIAKTGCTLFRRNNVFSKYLLFSFLLFVIHSQTNVISISEEIIFWIILGISASKST